MPIMLHELKTWPEFFEASWRGDKDFELQKNDRNFNVCDEILLREWHNGDQRYTGRVLSRRIKYIMSATYFGLQEGYVILGLDKV